jgi:dihydroxyacetone kinase-like predicted kinase
MLAYDGTGDLDELVAEMSRAAAAVHTAEITTAIKDAKAGAGQISAGQIIGIIDDEEIEAVGDAVADVALRTVHALVAP